MSSSKYEGLFDSVFSSLSDDSDRGQVVAALLSEYEFNPHAAELSNDWGEIIRDATLVSALSQIIEDSGGKAG